MNGVSFFQQKNDERRIRAERNERCDTNLLNDDQSAVEKKEDSGRKGRKKEAEKKCWAPPL